MRSDDEYASRIIRRLREAKGITQETLAGKLGVTFQQVQKYEKGLNRVSVGRLADISRALNVPPSLFFSIEGESEHLVDMVSAQRTLNNIKHILCGQGN